MVVPFRPFVLAIGSLASVCDHVREGRIDSGRACVHDGYQFGIPKWYPQQAVDTG
jgi:hypothetical protein